MNADHFAVQARASAAIWGRRPQRLWIEDITVDGSDVEGDVEVDPYDDEGGEA
jgi:hypothetical protein